MHLYPRQVRNSAVGKPALRCIARPDSKFFRVAFYDQAEKKFSEKREKVTEENETRRRERKGKAVDGEG